MEKFRFGPTAAPQNTTVTRRGRTSSSGAYPALGLHGELRDHPQANRYAMSMTGYGGTPASDLVAPYVFTLIPQLPNPNAHANYNARPFSLKSGRSTSSPKAHHSAASSCLQPTSPTSLPQIDARNRLSLGLSAIPLESLFSPPQPTSISPKPSPDRHRRPVHRSQGENGVNSASGGSALPAGSGMAAVGSLYSHPAQSSSTPSPGFQQSCQHSIRSNSWQTMKPSADHLQLAQPQSARLAARYRRRSFGSIETAGFNHSPGIRETTSPHSNLFVSSGQSAPPTQGTVYPPARPIDHRHSSGSDGVSSTRLGRSSRSGSAQSPVVAPMTSSISFQKEEARLAAPSGTAENGMRQPSPLSRPVNITGEIVDAQPNEALSTLPLPVTSTQGLAVGRLAAASKDDAEKLKSTSRLRSAFPFGSGAVHREATAQNNLEKNVANREAQPSFKRHSKYEQELEPQQARIAEKQEAAGLGESIYSGQGNFFTGSTGNLSISSTTSPASVMLRKMGKVVENGARSLTDLFRPKIVLGLPAVNEASMAQVSTEREKWNVDVEPHEQPGGGTGFPRMGRNSLDAKISSVSGAVSSDARSPRSIVDREKERAEVLAAVKKGILKRTDTNQPSLKDKAHDLKAPDFDWPQNPHMNESPRSSAPSTPAAHPPHSGHCCTEPITIQNNGDIDDCFTPVDRFGSLDVKKIPMSPHALIRKISFSPQIQLHYTWPSREYDRRGEITTCNRLTPMLAEQIKEELNIFKIEMEVHESSKVYTHLF